VLLAGGSSRAMLASARSLVSLRTASVTATYVDQCRLSYVGLKIQCKIIEPVDCVVDSRRLFTHHVTHQVEASTGGPAKPLKIISQ